MPIWMEQKGPESDVVISSRVRLARNYEDIPFPTVMGSEGATQVIQKTRDAVEIEKEDGDYQFLPLQKCSVIERQVLIEKHLASPDLIKHYRRGALLLKKDETVSIMMNEEDHLRLQCILPGFQLEEANRLVNELDDLIEVHTQYSFDEKIGYLTCCPTNAGTGMRASVMLHLPALAMTGYVGLILQTINKIGLAVRGTYGEGSEALGNMYQISNQITLGNSEEDIIRNLVSSCSQVIEKERAARTTILKNSRIELEDRLFRSYGIFTNARKMDSQEFMKLISDVRLAVDVQLLPNLDRIKLNRLMIQAQSANLQQLAGCELSPDERDIKRADLVRNTIGKE